MGEDCSMPRYKIEGGRSLEGVVTISGAKNAALPLICASLLPRERVTLTNMPSLSDIRSMNLLLEQLGTQIDSRNEVVDGNPCKMYTYQTAQTKSLIAPYDYVRKMRASYYVLGPLLAREHYAELSLPGGCAIGARPVDLHLSALEKMGARFDLEDGYILGRCRKLNGAHIYFDFPTVGGTENLLMAAALADGETILENAAREPEVVDLARFLIACGARIEGHGTSVIRIQGVPRLGGCTYRIMPDRIEAGTLLAAAGITDGELLLTDCPFEELDAVIAKMRQMGMEIEPTADGVLARRSCALRGVDVTTQPFPGFPTDMQAQIMSLMCLSEGSGVISETIFENRFMHVQELVRMGADIRLSGHTAIIRGVQRLAGAPVMASDLRASASLVLAGLAAKGTTTVQRIYHLDRGYEHIENKLNAVGARIRREAE